MAGVSQGSGIVGKHIGELDTPAMVVDLDVAEANIQRLQADLNRLRLANRPHIKTHKTVQLARYQVEAGAVGITCQKLGEAEVMADAGLSDILVPFNIVGEPKLSRLAALADRVTMCTVCDTPETLDGLARAARQTSRGLDLLVALDSGGHRDGVQNAEAALDLARRIADAPGLRFRGLFFYPSRQQVKTLLDQTRGLLDRAGIPVRVVSGGGTGAQELSREIGCTEHRSGTYSYADMNCVRAGTSTLDGCAQTVHVTVVTNACAGYATVDGGSKTFTNDGVGAGKPIGHVREYPDIILERMNEEHGILNLSQSSHRPDVGERLSIIPNHACGTTNLHDEVVATRNQIVVDLWPIEARGRLR